MMQAEATINNNVNIDALMSILGRYYQVRDDYLDIMGMVCAFLADLSRDFQLTDVFMAVEGEINKLQ